MCCVLAGGIPGGDAMTRAMKAEQGWSAAARRAICVALLLGSASACTTLPAGLGLGGGLGLGKPAAPPPDSVLADPSAQAFANALPTTGTVGKALNDTDRQAAAKAEIEALELSRTGAPVTWQNPETDSSGVVVPGPTYVVNNQECRDYIHTLSAGGAEQQLRGRACRSADGTWRPLN